MNKMKVYNQLPHYIQNVIVSWEGFKINQTRFGEGFFHKLKEVEKRQQLPFNEMLKDRDERFVELIKHCYHNVPYYNRLFKSLNLVPEDFKECSDVSKLPILTKETVRKNAESLVATSVGFKSIPQTTSGSTGTSLKIVKTEESINEQWATWWRFRRSIGINYKEWCAYFASRPVVPEKQIKPPYWRYNFPGKQLQFSAFHGTDSNYHLYAKKLISSKIKWIHGYPSVIVPFAQFVIDNQIDMKNQIRFVTTGGENLYDFQRNIIERAFKVRPYSHYGLTEPVANLSENIKNELVVDEDYSYVEFHPVSEIEYRIIGTDLSNYAMPLIRYDTNDIAIIAKELNESNNTKSNPRKVTMIDGRSGEHIKLPDGRRIGALSALFTETDSILEGQLIQAEDYNITIKFVSNTQDFDHDIEKVRVNLLDRIGNSISLKFEQVDKIQREPNGKLRYIISEIK